ncbi:MAG: hypothetical protein U9Q84_07465 [Thermodesulfobacteriota bacterium]|nr:hypothetical protein [Thermodesulfobacteriota bacterium]
MSKQAVVVILFYVLSYLLPLNASANEYDFEIPDTKDKPYHIGGNIEAVYTIYSLNKNSALYSQKFYNRKEGSSVDSYDLTLQLEGDFKKDSVKLYVKTNTSMTQNYIGWDDETELYEGVVSFEATPSFTVEAGKKVMKWGKGYAWNPAAFTSRPKNPDDPEASLEGYSIISLDYIKSLSGRIKTIAFTPAIIPVYNDLNSSFGETDHLNFAGKLYFLTYDTDIDIMFLAGKSIEDRIGFDFSRNFTTNFELHGEAVFINNFEKKYIDSNGNLHIRQSDVASYLLGIRFLNRHDTTFIAEIYRNGTGFSEEEISGYYNYIQKGYNTYETTGAESSLKKSLRYTKAYYSDKNFMKQYLYLKITQKEPFNILYFTPSLNIIFNAEDKSYSLTPELLYEPISNLELKFKFTLFHGNYHSEFGEKPYDYKAVCFAKYYF